MADDQRYGSRTGASGGPRGWQGRQYALLAGVVLALAGAVAQLLAPVGRQTPFSVSTELATLWQRQGWPAVLMVLVPVLAVAAPVAVPDRQRLGVVLLATVLLVIWVLAGAVSVGLFFVPAAVAMLTASGLYLRAKTRSA